MSDSLTFEQAAGRDWARISASQRGNVRAGLGIQGGNGIPFTPPGVAAATFHLWSNALGAVILAAHDEGKAIPAPAITGALGFGFTPGGLVLPTGGPSTVGLAGMLLDSSEIGVKDAGRKIQKAMLDMAESLAAPFSSKSPGGLSCMTLTNATRFWDGVSTCAIQYGFLAARTSISVADFMGAALDGAREGLENAAKTVGETAGKIAAEAGKVAGQASAGFFGGFGLVNTAVIVGGGLLIAKTVW